MRQRRAVGAPVEPRVDDDRARDVGGAVLVAAIAATLMLTPSGTALHIASGLVALTPRAGIAATDVAMVALQERTRTRFMPSETGAAP